MFPRRCFGPRRTRLKRINVDPRDFAAGRVARLEVHKRRYFASRSTLEVDACGHPLVRADVGAARRPSGFPTRASRSRSRRQLRAHRRRPLRRRRARRPGGRRRPAPAAPPAPPAPASPPPIDHREEVRAALARRNRKSNKLPKTESMEHYASLLVGGFYDGRAPWTRTSRPLSRPSSYVDAALTANEAGRASAGASCHVGPTTPKPAGRAKDTVASCSAARLTSQIHKSAASGSAKRPSSAATQRV